MSTLQDTERAHNRRKGQTLAEFAITLPILLILTFGIVEFGRIFQAWVTLQNAARAGARYASTGQYDKDRFVMDLEFLEKDPVTGEAILNDPTGFIPCVDDGPEADRTYPALGSAAADQRGTMVTIHPNGGGPEDAIQVYQGGLESLFASWNYGKNCDPRDDNDQARRKDMARILSIMDEARQGASGLYLEANSVTIPAGEDAKKNIDGWPWFEVWKVPFAHEDDKAWFNVTVCSSRQMIDRTNSVNYFERIDPTTGNPSPVNTRFVTYLGDTTLRDPDGNDLSTTSNPELPSVGCMLNESMITTPVGLINDAGKPWLDPGGPSDTVTVIVTFNHPLVTPLGLAPYIRMQARRSAIVEAFRSADPQNAFSDVPNTEIEPPTQTPLPTSTPLPTETPSNTPTGTVPPTITPTRTQPPPFTCDLITITPVSNGNYPGIFGNTVALQIKNDNVQATYLTRVILKWPTIPDYPNMFLSEMALNGVPHWKGMDASDRFSTTNTTDTDTDSSVPANYFINTPVEDRTIAGQNNGGWTGQFNNGPLLYQYITINHFAGTEFYLFNPLTPLTPCRIPLTVPPPQPSPTPNPNQPTNTATFTPDCVGPLITVRFAGFENFGIVRLEVLNQRSVVSTLTDFTIKWIQKIPGVLTLDRVTAVSAPGQPNSVSIWNSGSPTQDLQPDTNGKSEGTWVQDFTFPPNSLTSLYIDFGGVSGYLSDNGIGMTPSDFNGSQFRLGCGTPGNNGGNGGEITGLINLSQAPTPKPTNTPGPSNTPRPTNTPGPTNTPKPTNTQGPPQPTNTPKPPASPKPPPTATTPPPPPTLPGGGCIDGCG